MTPAVKALLLSGLICSTAPRKLNWSSFCLRLFRQIMFSTSDGRKEAMKAVLSPGKKRKQGGGSLARSCSNQLKDSLIFCRNVARWFSVVAQTALNISIFIISRTFCPELVCVCVCVSPEGPAEPAECGHLVSEGESAGGAATVQAAVGWQGDCGDQAPQSDQAAAAGPRRLLHQEPGAPGTHTHKHTHTHTHTHTHSHTHSHDVDKYQYTYSVQIRL